MIEVVVSFECVNEDCTETWETKAHAKVLGEYDVKLVDEYGEEVPVVPDGWALVEGLEDHQQTACPTCVSEHV